MHKLTKIRMMNYSSSILQKQMLTAQIVFFCSVFVAGDAIIFPHNSSCSSVLKESKEVQMFYTE